MIKLVAYFLAVMTCIAGASMPTHAQSSPPAPATSAPAIPQQSRAQQLMGDIAPKFADLTDTVLFGDVWARPQLSNGIAVWYGERTYRHEPPRPASISPRTRASERPDEEELVEAITHLAFYAGWPSAVSRGPVAREVFKKN